VVGLCRLRHPAGRCVGRCRKPSFVHTWPVGSPLRRSASIDSRHLVSSGSSACPPGAWRSVRTSRDAPNDGLSAIGSCGAAPLMATIPGKDGRASLSAVERSAYVVDTGQGGDTPTLATSHPLVSCTTWWTTHLLLSQGQFPDASCCTTEASTLHDNFRSLTCY
jgi:hypothetical protein